MPKLHVVFPGGQELTHELSEDVVTIGRLPDNIIQINDASVSSHHAQLSLAGTDYYLTDLNSTNGTRVNGEQVKETTLRAGDRIQFGKIEATYAADLAGGGRPLPEQEVVQAKPAETSHRPADFANASPFKQKRAKKNPVGAAIFALAVISILAFAGAMFAVLTLQPPQ
jgi:pSer/pThr/pTyr-binding forkhead associated (FHA) protein